MGFGIWDWAEWVCVAGQSRQAVDLFFNTYTHPKIRSGIVCKFEMMVNIRVSIKIRFDVTTPIRQEKNPSVLARVIDWIRILGALFEILKLVI